MRWIMLGAVETMPEGMVKGPLKLFPRNSVVTQASRAQSADYKGLMA